MKPIQGFLAVLIILSISVLITSCYSFQRSPESGYSTGSTKSSLSGWKRASRETTHKAQPSESNNNSSEIKIRLKQLENSMQGRRELEQYSKSLPWFANDEEKIEFLSAGAFEERQKWLQNNKFYERQKNVTSQMQELLDAQDIAVGMPESLVKKAWGEPTHVDVSGIPQFHNQKWVYSKMISSQEGFKTEKKIVYFEGGKVVGWEVE
jgi:hypothetical protein